MSFKATIKAIKAAGISFGSVENPETKVEEIEIRGTATSSLLEFNNQNGGIDYAIRIKLFSEEGLPTPDKCEGLELLRGYDFVPFLRDGVITLKPKKGKDGLWAFTGALPEEGEVVKVTVKPGVYINAKSMQYGFFFKIISF